MGKAKQSNKIVPTKGPFTSIALKSLESLPPPNSSPARLPFHPGPRFPLPSPSAPSFDHPISSRLYPGPHLAPITSRDRRHIHQSHLPYHEHNEFCSPPPPYNPLTPNETPPETINTATSRDSFGSAASTAAFPPPLPPRGKVLVGRHAARFDVKTPKSSFGKGDDARSHHKRGNNAAEMDSIRIRKKFLHPMMQSRRHCTDVLCCFIFVVFVVAWLVVAAFGFLWGKPEHLLHPTNSNGALCGVERKGFYDLRSVTIGRCK
ncbi:unnamed protein product [Anisakis simplex]|uniref:Extensin-like n=1 Tax=Anisakis simplex TaxID=6269 RepID=A0A0M3K5I1_ANISI|nr:unnamed protein product [Anisakis simplex]